MKRIIVGVAAAVAMAACGGSSSSAPTASVNGSTHGQAVQGQNSTSGPVTISSNGQASNVGAIVISNDANFCSDATANRQPKNLQFIVLALADVNATNGTTSPPAAPGDYQIYAGTGAPTSAKIAVLAYSQTDAMCKNQAAMDAAGSSGVVHLTGVNNGVFSGTFDVIVAETDASGNATSTTDHWTGSFNPSSCPGLSAAVSNQTAAACF